MQKGAVMPPEDPDDLVGIPVRPPQWPSSEFRSVPARSAVEIDGRNAADEVIPLGHPTSVTAVSPEAQSRRHAERDREEAAQALQKVLQSDAEGTDGILRRTCRGLLTT